MFNKVGVIFLVLQISLAQKENHDWDLAVVTDDRIELLLTNGSLIGSTFGQFSTLKAVTFDNVRNQFVVSDMDEKSENDTIFTVQLNKETDVTPIIEDLPDEVQGLAIDPITDILYWTDSINRTINFVHLNDSTYQSNVLFKFTDQIPQDISIDVCNRFIYWSNCNMSIPSIERAKLDGTQHEVLIDSSSLHKPMGISVDHSTQRLYWIDKQHGIYYAVESSNFDGKERETVYRGTYLNPFGLAVDAAAIYWTDTIHNVLWKLSKSSQNIVPEELVDFQDKRPRGVIARNEQIKSLDDCNSLTKIATPSKKLSNEMLKTESDYQRTEEVVPCLNGGRLTDTKFCRCPRGFAGTNCEISLCHNYCVHGDCFFSPMGNPQCHCPTGFGGKRCEKDICEGFCLNGGICTGSTVKEEIPICNCQEGFSGYRCEKTVDICDVFCEKRHNDILISEQKEIICSCVGGTADVSKSNFSSLPLTSKSDRTLFLDHFQDTTFLAMTCLMFIMLLAIITLSAYTCSLRRRPRIKKRIIVNKNITPLTYRPQPTVEQCEITIENCCNMNICETPCFEPPQLPCCQKTEDKKKLLSNMENGEDFY